MATVLDRSATDTQTKQLATSHFLQQNDNPNQPIASYIVTKISTALQALAAPNSASLKQKGKGLMTGIRVCHCLGLCSAYPVYFSRTMAWPVWRSVLVIGICLWETRMSVSPLEVWETSKCELRATYLTSLSFSFLKAKEQIIIVLA